MDSMGVLDDIDEIINQLDSPESGYQSPDRPSDRLNDFYRSYSKEIGPHLEIVEQPQNLYRFRYITEFKDNPHGPLTGQNSSKANKTFPTVKLNNFNKKAIIRCWLFVNNRKDVHVHQLLTKNDGRGIRCEPHDVVVDVTNNFTAGFEGLNIIHAVIKGKDYLECFHKKKAHVKSGFYLNLENLPFDQRSLQAEVKSMEKNRAVLCFEAFDFDTKEKLDEIFSHEVKNSKNPKTSTLKISRQSHKFGGANGGTEVFIFVEKVTKDIKIIFFELGNREQIIWEKEAIIEENWHQLAIAFRTPSYKTTNLQEEKKVYFKLVRESDGSYSNEMEFFYQPEFRNQANYSEPLISKKRKLENTYTFPYSPTSTTEYSSDSNPGNYTFGESIINDVNLINFPQAQMVHGNPNVFQNFEEDEFYNGIMMPGATAVASNNFEEQIDLPTVFDSDSADYCPPKDEVGLFRELWDSSWIRIQNLLPISKVKNKTKLELTRDALNAIKNYFPKNVDVIEYKECAGYVLELPSLEEISYIIRGKIEDLIVTIDRLALDRADDIKKMNDFTLLSNLMKCVTENFQVLQDATEVKRIELLQRILKEINERNLLRKFSLRNVYNKTPLHMAVEKGKIYYLKPLLDAGFDVNDIDSDHNSALHLAVKYEFLHSYYRPECASILLSQPNVNANVKNYDGENALHIACERNNISFVERLVEIADLNSQCEKGGDTPLHIAAKYGLTEIANILLEAGAKLDIPNYANITPLERAIDCENLEVIKLFLSKTDFNDRKNIYVIEEKLNSVESEEIYNLLVAYLKNKIGYKDFQAVTDEEINLSSYLKESCTLNDATK